MSKKLTYEEVKSYIESQGYQLLSKEYKNNREKLLMQCPNNHIFYLSYHNFKNRKKCPICNNQKLHYIDVKKFIEYYGYKLLSKKYKNNKTKLKIECTNNHIFYMSFDAFKRGQRCPTCLKKGKYNNIKNIKNEIKKSGYELLSKEYKNSKEKLKIKCPYGHIFYMTYNNFQRGQECPSCVRKLKSSKAEKEISKYIDSIYNGKIINNDRNTIINPDTGYNLELDVYLPELNKAIEFNGTY